MFSSEETLHNMQKQSEHSNHFISERRRETRQITSSCSHMGKQNNIITREISILAIWFMQQKVNIFWCRTDIRDEPALPKPARPGPAVTLFDGFFSNMLEEPNFKLLHNIDIDLKSVLSSFQRHFYINSEVIPFFVMTDFCSFYRKTG